MPPHQNPSTDVTLSSIREQLSTLIAISAANVRRLDAIITQMATVNILIGIQTETMAKLIPHPPPFPPSNQQPRSPPPTSTPPLPPPQQSLLPPPPPKPLKSSMSTQHPLPPLPQPPPSKVTFMQFRPVTFQPFNPQFPALVVVCTRMQDLVDKVHLKDGGIDMCLGPYRRPPPWSDPSKKLYIKWTSFCDTLATPYRLSLKLFIDIPSLQPTISCYCFLVFHATSYLLGYS
ncbi:unnamed protein product [Lactuca virosa]|uniref:Uncharacterized protein n=1 Tax=Lactuca virosa TaxID=75947 RepID=A0AAU9LST8_9ASTR|nr:unnamed protein product [Lactuca virosa]